MAKTMNLLPIFIVSSLIEPVIVDKKGIYVYSCPICPPPYGYFSGNDVEFRNHLETSHPEVTVSISHFTNITRRKV